MVSTDMKVAAGHTGKPDVFHPVPIDRRPERRCIFTVAVGDKFSWMFDITLPYMRAYCKRHNIDLIVVDDNYRVDEHPCYMKQFINTLWWRYDRVCYIDSDVLILPNSPNIFNVIPADKCGAFRVVDYSGLHGEYAKRLKTNASYLKPYAEEYNKRMRELGLPEANLPDDWKPDNYWNAGVFICTKKTNPHIPPVAGIMRLPTSNHFDQNYFNLMIQAHNIPMYDIGSAWNRRVGFKVAGTSSYLDGAYFIHYLGLRRKGQMINDLKRIPAAGSDLQYMEDENIESGIPEVAALCSESTPHIEVMENSTSPIRPYKVNFVGAIGNPKWILEKMQDHIIAAIPTHATHLISDYAIDTPDVLNYFNPYRYYVKSRFATDVTFQTHPEVKPLFTDSAKTADHVVVMCDKYKQELMQAGVSIDNITHIMPGLDDVYRNPKLRIFNPTRMERNAGYKNRKGVDTWNVLCNLDWLHCVCTDGKLDTSQVYDEYLKADAIVSTATMEGGPMSMLEGLAMGKPVFGRFDVGLINQLAHAFTYTDDVTLIEALNVLYQEKKQRSDSVVDYSWKNWASDHWYLFDSLMRNRKVSNCIPSRESGIVTRHRHTNCSNRSLRGAFLR